MVLQLGLFIGGETSQGSHGHGARLEAADMGWLSDNKYIWQSESGIAVLSQKEAGLFSQAWRKVPRFKLSLFVFLACLYVGRWTPPPRLQGCVPVTAR